MFFRVACSLMLLAAMSPLRAPAAADTAWSLDNGDPPVFEPAFLGNKNYTEGWDFFFDFGDGTFLSTQLAVSNFGKGDHRTLVIAKLSRPDGDDLVLKNGRPRERWSYQPGGFDIRVADHRFAGEDGRYTLHLKNSNGEIEVTAVAELPAWDLGYTRRDPGDNGGEDRYQYVSVFAPKLSVTGRYRATPDGKDNADSAPWVDLGTGSGMGLRQVSSVALSEVLKDWVRISPAPTGAVSDTELPVINLFLSKQNGPQHSIALFRDGAMLGEPIAFTAPESLAWPEKVSECCELEIPVSARDGDRSIEGRITVRRLVQHFNLLDELKPWERFIARFFRTPVQYRYWVDYDLQIDLGDGPRPVQGRGIADRVKIR